MKRKRSVNWAAGSGIRSQGSRRLAAELDPGIEEDDMKGHLG